MPEEKKKKKKQSDDECRIIMLLFRLYGFFPLGFYFYFMSNFGGFFPHWRNDHLNFCGIAELGGFLERGGAAPVVNCWMPAV